MSELSGVVPPAVEARFAVEALVAHGGMGRVYRARERASGEVVAIKVLMKIDDAPGLERFLREGRLLARLDHPDVLRLMDAGVHEGQPYLVTDFLSGGTLRARMVLSGALSAGDAVELLAPVLRGLAACHALGVVHRDVKPENILLDAQGRLRLADLGLASSTGEIQALTATGAILGTPRYLSPEQARGTSTTAASDVYSLAIVLYELIAGRPPFVDSDIYALLCKHADTPAPPLTTLAAGVPPLVAEVIHRALSKDPAQRPADAAALQRELQAALGGRRVVRPQTLLRGAALAAAAALLAFAASGRTASPLAEQAARDKVLAARARAVLTALPGAGVARLVEEVQRGEGPHDAVLIALASRLAGDLRYPDALACLERAAALNPRSARARAMQGKIRMELGEMIRAGQDLRAAVDLDPRDAYGGVALALWYANNDRRAEAIAELDRVLGHAPDDPEALRLRATFGRQ